MATRIADLPPDDRPRERLWRCGPRALSTVELLALVLRNGRPGESAIELAARLLADHGGLAGLTQAVPEELAARAGMGPAKAAALLAAAELGRLLALPEPDAGPVNVCALGDLAQRDLGGLRREHALVFVLDSGHRLRRTVTVGAGSAQRSPMPVREVLNAVLRNDGTSFVLAHNHPSGLLEPSRQDLEVTAELAKAADVCGLRLVDHLVVTSSGWISLGAWRGARRPRNAITVATQGV